MRLDRLHRAYPSHHPFEVVRNTWSIKASTGCESTGCESTGCESTGCESTGCESIDSLNFVSRDCE